MVGLVEGGLILSGIEDGVLSRSGIGSSGDDSGVDVNLE